MQAGHGPGAEEEAEKGPEEVLGGRQRQGNIRVLMRKNYLLKTRSADMDHYRRFAGSVLWQLPGVRETRTYAVMEEVKTSSRLHLPGV